MKQLLDYSLIADTNIIDFEKSVDNLIDDGYEPYGSPTIFYNPSIKQICFYQALIRYKHNAII